MPALSRYAERPSNFLLGGRTHGMPAFSRWTPKTTVKVETWAHGLQRRRRTDMCTLAVRRYILGGFALCAASIPGHVSGQTMEPSFAISGEIEAFTLDTPGNPVSAAKDDGQQYPGDASHQSSGDNARQIHDATRSLSRCGWCHAGCERPCAQRSGATEDRI